MAATTGARLRILEGVGRGREFPLPETPLTIGRHPGEDVVFRDDKLAVPDKNKIVSRNHAKIVYQNGEWVITDNSVNGTLLDGRKITHSLLQNGSKIEIGPYVLEFLVSRAPKREPAPPRYERRVEEVVREEARVPVSPKENPFVDFTKVIKSMGFYESEVKEKGPNWTLFAFIGVGVFVLILIWIVIRSL